MDSRLVDRCVDYVIGAPTSNPDSGVDVRELWTDTVHHLIDAQRLNRPELIARHISWWSSVTSSRGLENPYSGEAIGALKEALRANLPDDDASNAVILIDRALDEPLAAEPSSFLVESGEIEPLATEFLDLLLRAERRKASRIVLNAVEAGTDVRDIYLLVLQPVMREVGRRWQYNRLSVAVEHYASAAVQLVMSQLYDRIFCTDRVGHAAVACCIGRETHEIGLRMVADFFEMEGWDCHYLGADVPAADVVAMLQERNADALMISATTRSHIDTCRQLIVSVREAFGQQVMILVGGLAFSAVPELWREVGADATAGDAAGAVQLVQERRS